MTKRPAWLTRRAVLFTFGAVMGKFNILSAAQRAKTPTTGPSHAQLTIDLDQWGSMVFKHRGKSVTIPVSEVFDALVAGSPER